MEIYRLSFYNDESSYEKYEIFMLKEFYIRTSLGEVVLKIQC
jgi:hypothetical protein